MSLKNGEPPLRASRARAPSQPDANACAPCPDKFPASAAFDAINDALKSEADKKDAIKQANAIFAFTLKNKAGETESWHIDLKNQGVVGTGVGDKPTGECPLVAAG